MATVFLDYRTNAEQFATLDRGFGRLKFLEFRGTGLPVYVSFDDRIVSRRDSAFKSQLMMWLAASMQPSFPTPISLLVFKQMLCKLPSIQRGALAWAAVAGLAGDAQDMLTSLVPMCDPMVALPNVNAAPIDEHMYDQ